MSKKLLILPAFILGAFLMFTNTSCTDKCKDKDCGTGTCLDGTCECDPGFEVDAKGACTIRTADKISGAYSVIEDCSASPAAAYIAGVTPGTGATDVNITNFWNLFQNAVKATITTPTTLTIARQEPDNDKFFVEGTGTISTNASGKIIITWTYKVTDETSSTIVTDNCTSTVFTHN